MPYGKLVCPVTMELIGNSYPIYPITVLGLTAVLKIYRPLPIKKKCLMKVCISPIVLSLLVTLTLNSCNNAPENGQTDSSTPTKEPTVQYDSAKARAYGADLYGMKTYVMAFLKQGANDSLPKSKTRELQKKHQNNIARLAEKGYLVLSGPFMDSDSIRGIFLLNVQTLKDARAIVKTDPAVQAGVLKVELRPWYGSAALMEIPKLHKQLEKKQPSQR